MAFGGFRSLARSLARGMSMAKLAHVTLAACAAGAGLMTATVPAVADSATFEGFRTEAFGNRPILNGNGIVSLKAPYRPDDVRAVPMSVDARLTDGRTISKITFIVDNNPSPVVAAFDIGGHRSSASIAIRFRLNQQSDVRAVVETSDGQLYMVERLVKFAGGQAACAAPPSAPPEVIAANMGKMSLAEIASGAQTSLTPRMKLELSHPNHTGMVLDQITLLYTPVKMVEKIAVKQGSDTVFTMAGSIALNENPVIEFDMARNGASDVTIDVLDTDGQRFAKTVQLGPNS